MKDKLTINIDVGITGQQFAHCVELYNEEIQKRIQQGIDEALDELLQEDKLVSNVKFATKKQILQMVERLVKGFYFQNKVETLFVQGIQDKVLQYADKLGDKILKAMEDDEKRN